MITVVFDRNVNLFASRNLFVHYAVPSDQCIKYSDLAIKLGLSVDVLFIYYVYILILC